MKILSNSEILTIEERTIAAQGIQPETLVERVAAALSAEIKHIARREDPLIVLAGWGGNGADALELSRLLALDGYSPEVYLFNIGGDRLSPLCATMRDRVINEPRVKLHEISGSTPFRWPDPSNKATIIDGLFGSGLNRPLPRTFQLLAHNINRSGATVVSIDIPSGLFAEWNGQASRQDMVHAHHTFSVEFPKLSFLLGDNGEVVGDWKVIRIGYDNAAVKAAPFTYMLVDRSMVAKFLPSRGKFVSKADFGHVIIYAGSRGKIGAAVLSAMGALRAGAGKVTVYSCNEAANILQTAVPSAMFIRDQRSQFITSFPFETYFNSIAVGPGIGTADETCAAFEKLVKAASASGQRMVIDADGLNIIAKRPNVLNYLPALSVLTPHAAEFDRIFGCSDSEEERLKKAIRCAEDYSLIIVLKGHYTVIVRPDGKIMFNSTGTPAMATPGSGDVLTGVIASLMATGLKSELAAFVGPYIHGLAGEIACKEHGEYGVMAEDIASNIGKAIKQIMDNTK